MSYLLGPIPPGSVEASSVEKMFRRGWLHPEKKYPQPRITHVYEVKMPNHFLDRYTTYRGNIEVVREMDRNDAEVFLFHGTNRDCLLGDNGYTKLCNSSTCSLCGIIQNNFRLDIAGINTRFLRFGRAIYTTPVSSKADDYSVNLKPSRYKALLLNIVAVGRTFETYDNMTQLTRCVPYHDSVTGLPGGQLNYGEVAVYDARAIRPRYLVIYDISGLPESLSGTPSIGYGNDDSDNNEDEETDAEAGDEPQDDDQDVYSDNTLELQDDYEDPEEEPEYEFEVPAEDENQAGDEDEDEELGHEGVEYECEESVQEEPEYEDQDRAAVEEEAETDEEHAEEGETGYEYEHAEEPEYEREYLAEEVPEHEYEDLAKDEPEEYECEEPVDSNVYEGTGDDQEQGDPELANEPYEIDNEDHYEVEDQDDACSAGDSYDDYDHDYDDDYDDY